MMQEGKEVHQKIFEEKDNQGITDMTTNQQGVKILITQKQILHLKSVDNRYRQSILFLSKEMA